MTGTVSVISLRGFTLEGYVQTSHGKVDTKIVQSIDFSNKQKYNVAVDGSVYDQGIQQLTTIVSATTTTQGGNTINNYKQFTWPLNLSYDFTANPDGSYQQTTKLQQGFQSDELATLNGAPTHSQTLS